VCVEPCALAIAVQVVCALVLEWIAAACLTLLINGHVRCTGHECESSAFAQRVWRRWCACASPHAHVSHMRAHFLCTLLPMAFVVHTQSQSCRTLCLLHLNVVVCARTMHVQCTKHMRGAHVGSFVFGLNVVASHVACPFLDDFSHSGDWFACCAHSQWRFVSISATAAIRVNVGMRVIVVQCVLSCVLCVVCSHDSCVIYPCGHNHHSFSTCTDPSLDIRMVNDGRAHATSSTRLRSFVFTGGAQKMCV
jgi:hypothetical protein